MFCPNCGKDCGGANFCPICGMRLKNSAKAKNQQFRWTAGMPCPHCGGVGLNGNKCAFCGVQLLFDQQQETKASLWGEDSFEIPKGKCNGFGGYIQLERTALRIWNKYALFSREYIIPYKQLTSVTYVRSGKKLLADGFLIIRWQGNTIEPLPTGYARRNDKTTINFGYMHNIVFYHIYCVLMTCAPKTTMFKMETPKSNIPGLDEWARSKEFDKYFDRFNPDRERATLALCREVGVRYTKAVEIVNRAFDMRQQAVYANEPSIAVRDLNRAIRINSVVPHIYKND